MYRGDPTFVYLDSNDRISVKEILICGVFCQFLTPIYAHRSTFYHCFIAVANVKIELLIGVVYSEEGFETVMRVFCGV